MSRVADSGVFDSRRVAGSGSIRTRARAARGRSRRERERARRLADSAATLFRRTHSLREWHRRMAGRRLDWETATLDDGVVAWQTMAPFLEFDSHVVGRDPVIEQAKTLLCHQLGISRRDAFEILRRASTRRNQKLHEVARRLVADARGAGA